MFIYVNVLRSEKDGLYYLGYDYNGKKRDSRSNQCGCISWKHAAWFDDKTNLEKVIRMLYLRYAVNYEVVRKAYKIKGTDE